jgi:hypothetical protein
LYRKIRVVGEGEDVVEVTLRQLLQAVNLLLSQPKQARGLLKIRGKRKPSQRHCFVNKKTKQAIVTSAEVKTDDL